MDTASDAAAYDEALGRAALEALRPGLAHWAAGHLDMALRRLRALMESGRLPCFETVSAAICSSRPSPGEDVVLRDGTGAVPLRPGEPWEAAELAARLMAAGKPAWGALRFAPSVQSMGRVSWASAQLRAGESDDFEGFWSRLLAEAARAEARAFAELSGRGIQSDRAREIEALRERSEALLEARRIDEAAGPGVEKSESARRI